MLQIVSNLMPYAHRGKGPICESIQKCLLLDLSTLMVLGKMCPVIIPLNIRGAVIANLTLISN